MHRKLIQLAKRQQAVEDYDTMLTRLARCKSKKREIELIELLEEYDKKLAEVSKPLAFEDKGDEEQTKLFQVAQSQDEWVRVEKGCFRARYICQ